MRTDKEQQEFYEKAKKFEEERIKEEEKQRKQRFLSSLPERYKSADYKDVDFRIKKAFEEIKETRKGIYIYGGVGIGKTHIAVALRKQCYSQELRCRFYNAVDILDKIRDDYRNKDTYNLDKILDYKGLLIIDDIGAEKITEWVLETFYRIINQRYEDMLPVIFTSNFSLGELSERLGERISSRIAGSCEVVELTGNDKRL